MIKCEFRDTDNENERNDSSRIQYNLQVGEYDQNKTDYNLIKAKIRESSIILVDLRPGLNWSLLIQLRLHHANMTKSL